MKALAVSLVISVVLASCAPRPRPPRACEEIVRRVIHADTAFTQAERIELDAAADAWLGFSGGRVHQTIVYDVDFSSTSSVVRHARDAMLMRVLEWMPIVDIADTRTSSKRSGGGPKVRVYGWTEAEPVRVFLVVDRIPDLRGVTMHELGHAAGLRWPDCDPMKDDCDHARDPSVIMSSSFDPKAGHTFWQADLELCRASCLCP